MTSPVPRRHVGRRLRRLEDRRYLVGAAAFVDDVALPGMLYAAFARSPHGHARLRRIDTRAASAAPGVVAVATGAEVNAATAPLRIAPPIEGLVPTEIQGLPQNKVRFVGDPVAIVVATSRYAAEDAAALVEVEYEPLPAVVDPARAAEPGQPLVDDALESNQVCYQRYSYGDPEAAFREAEEVLAMEFHQQRQAHAPMENRGCVASWNPGDESITLWNSTQVPHPMRTTLAARLHISESRARVITPDVGGGFGQKIPLFREELSCCVLSRRLGRPVKWIESRRENLLAAGQAREDSVRLEVAARRDGVILGLRASILADMGAYCWYPANYMARVVGMLLPGPYRIAHYSYELRSVLTNKCHAVPYRAPMLICSWVTEGMIERLARHLGLDPLEVRRRNLLRRDDLPYTSATGQRYQAISADETTERAAARIGYAAFRAQQAEARRQGRLVGIGMCTYVEPTGYGSAFYRSAGIAGSGHDVATVRMEPSGSVTVQLGIVSQGQGHATTMAQVVADQLGVEPDDVRVLAGDTDAAPYGMGTRGSRGAVVGTGACMAAAGALRDKLVRIAAHLLETAPEDVELSGRRATVRGLPGRSLALADLARTAYLAPMDLPPGMEPGLEAYRAYDPPPLTYSNATHACTVEVDRATGEVRLGRYVVVEDCGTLINPTVVEGQIHGAVAQGLAGALYEEVVYDAQGQNLSATLMDYAVPTAAMLPRIEIEHLETPAPDVPGGVKGMSEGGVMGASAAVCNAVADALAPLGATVDRQPLTPERLRRLIQAAG